MSLTQCDIWYVIETGSVIAIGWENFDEQAEFDFEIHALAPADPGALPDWTTFKNGWVYDSETGIVSRAE